MKRYKGSITDIKSNRNTISVVGDFKTTKDIPLLADGVEVHPLVFNPIDNRHYSMIWLQEGCTIKQLEAKGTNAIKIGCWSTLTTPKRPRRSIQLVVSPSGSGTDFSHDNPGNFIDAVALAVENGDTEIVMKDGVYQQETVSASDFMAEFRKTDQGGNILPFEKVSVIAESPRGAIISNLADDSSFRIDPDVNAPGLFNIQGAPGQIHQLHAVVDGKVERLQEGATNGLEPDLPWDRNSLVNSPIGGWFIDTNGQLVVKLPDQSNPIGQLRISNPDHKEAWLFAGATDLWIEGLVFEYWLHSQSLADNLGSSLIFNGCQQIMVSNCESRYTMSYACSFANCTDYIVEDCDFIDGETFTSYLHMRHGPNFNEPNSPRFTGCVRHSNSSLASIRNNCWTECFVVNHFIQDSTTECIEFHHNHIFQARNHPVFVKGNGGRHAIWANRFDTCGQVMPNNEGGSPVSPIYWINNLAVNAGFFGTTFRPNEAVISQTSRSIKGNRFGEATENPVGQYFFYYNTLRVEWFPPNGEGANQIEVMNAWDAQGKDHSASRYYNNIFTTIFRDILHNNQRHIWRDPSLACNVCLHLQNLCKMHWDHNQYFWDKGDQAGAFNLKSNSVTSFTFAEMQEFVKKTLNKEWEPEGAFLDPKFDASSHPTKTICAKIIPGVTGNLILDDPAQVSGSNV